MKYLLLIILALSSTIGYSQTATFKQMSKRLDANSLPLVNLSVNTARLNSKGFVNGEIEITDYQKRTNPLSQTVKYLCKIRYRGASALKYDKKSFAVNCLTTAIRTCICHAKT